MKTKAIIEGLTIMEKYRDGEGGYNTGAEHDTLYVYPTAKPISGDDLDRLVALGWSQEDAALIDDEEFSARHYDPEESWYCFT